MVVDRLCCRLRLYIEQIWGPSSTTVKCCCAHFVKNIYSRTYIGVRTPRNKETFLPLNICQKSLFLFSLPLTTYLHFSHHFYHSFVGNQSKNCTVDKLHRERGKNVFRLLYQDEKWQAAPQQIFQTMKKGGDRTQESMPTTTSTSLASWAIWWAGLVLEWGRTPGERGEGWPERSKTSHPKNTIWNIS